MIIVREWAGLGNQLFLYAYYRSLQEKGQAAKLDISYFDTINPHGAGYQIDKIFPNSKNVYATALECRKLAVYQMDRFHRVLRKLGINQKSYLSQTKTYHSTGYDPEMAELSGDHYVEGYFQSERYFREIADQLRRELTFTEKIPEVVHLVEQKIHDSDCVSIHIRRGDYAAGGQSTTADTYYYINAIREMEKRHPGYTYFVFSDDIPWCKEYFSDRKDILPKGFCPEYVQTGAPAWTDMYLMSKCDHNIICDSSFSWWGAWLNSNPEKVVLVPERWLFGTVSYKKDNVYPEGWIKVSLNQ